MPALEIALRLRDATIVEMKCEAVDTSELNLPLDFGAFFIKNNGAFTPDLRCTLTNALPLMHWEAAMQDRKIVSLAENEAATREENAENTEKIAKLENEITEIEGQLREIEGQLREIEGC